MIFNPLVRRRPPQNPMNMAPAGYDAPPSPGMAPLAPGAAPAAPTNFQRSLDLSRYNDASSAATFARMAPVSPYATDSAFYGKSTTADLAAKTAAAARAAYVTRQENTANAQNPYGTGTGQLTAQRMGDDANFRANAESGANVKLSGSQAAVNSANAAVGIPSEANQRNAAANASNATAAETTAMTPGKVEGQKIQNQGAAYMAPMAPLVAGAEIARKQAETAAIQQKTPAEVKAIEGNAGAGAEINRQKSGLIDEQQRLLNAKMANMAPAPAAAAPEPGADFELKQKQYEFYKKNGMDAQAQAVFPPRTMTPVPQQDLGGAKAPQPAGPMAPPTSTQSSAAVAPGTTRYFQDPKSGQNVLHRWDGKQWARAG